VLEKWVVSELCVEGKQAMSAMDYNLCMADDSIPVLFDESGEEFEHLGKTNGSRYWLARDLMQALGYTRWDSFKKIIVKAFSACAIAEINPTQTMQMFVPHQREINGRIVEDYKLSRSACYMVTMGAASDMPNVARAQVYFSSLMESLLGYAFEQAEGIDRIGTREKISEREIMLSKAAAEAGVTHFGLFRSAGYRGMYDMPYSELRQLRGVQGTDRSVLDFMGRDELAANLFRLTLTEGRLRRDRVASQAGAEHVAEQVGRTVRKTLIDETGVAPEQLPTAQDVREVRKSLKRGATQFGAHLDNIQQERIDEAETVRCLLPEAREDAVPGCPECAGGNPASHNGSLNCTSGSIASGGTRAHCTCDYCY
jgi:DNA-damage-inducible protein D